MKKLRILNVSNHFFPCAGGVEKVVEDLCVQLRKRGHESEVLCLNRCAYSEKKLPEKGNYGGIKITRIPFADCHYYKVAPFQLSFLEKFDVVHVHGISFFSDYLALTKALHKKPLVLSTHGGIFHTGKIAGIKKAYFGAVAKNALKKFDRVIAVSKNDYKLFLKIVPKHRLALIENGVRVEEFAGIKPKYASKKMIFVGRISRNKRIELLIKAFALAAKNEPKARLYIAGEDWEKILPELKKCTKESEAEEKIKFLGKISDSELKRRMAECAFFASASRFEGFGISAVEAMSAGLVPILQGNDSFREFVAEGKNGFIVDFADNQKAGKKIAELFTMDGKRLTKTGARARESAQKYSWKERAAEFEKVYAEACGK